jgi:hypothetical protein
MNAFRRALWRFLRPTEPLPTAPVAKPVGGGYDPTGPQINPGVSPGTTFKPSDPNGPQINPGPGTDAPKKGGETDGPQINPGPGDGWTPRVTALGLGRRSERVYSSRPFGVAQDDFII